MYSTYYLKPSDLPQEIKRKMARFDGSGTLTRVQTVFRKLLVITNQVETCIWPQNAGPRFCANSNK